MHMMHYIAVIGITATKDLECNECFILEILDDFTLNGSYLIHYFLSLRCLFTGEELKLSSV